MREGKQPVARLTPTWEDFKKLAQYYDDHITDGTDNMEEAYALLKKYGLVDDDGFWIG